jgi:hypothetical protein
MQPTAQTIGRFARLAGEAVCCALFFVASDERPRQKLLRAEVERHGHGQKQLN